jgi:hypothetical protein
MHRKLLRTAAAVAVFGGIGTLGFGSIQTALASPPTYTFVPCPASLSSAISAADSGAVLILAPGCTYWLTSALPTVMNELTVVGYDSSLVRSYARDTDQFSILTVGSTNGDLTLIDVNIRNGGGGESGVGGAIYINPGTVAIHGGTFSGNIASDGGAIWNSGGTLTVDGATFTNNNGHDGGAVYSGYGTATLNGDTFTGNSGEFGGAVYNDDDNDMTITGGIFRHNGSSKYGGAIYNDYRLIITQAMIGQNTSYYGGGVYNDSGATLTIDYSMLTLNTATSEEFGGGAIFNLGEAVNLSDDAIGMNSPNNCYPVGSIAGCRG